MGFSPIAQLHFRQLGEREGVLNTPAFRGCEPQNGLRPLVTCYCMIQKIVLSEKLDKITHHFQPAIVGEVSGCHVKLVKFNGEFLWHSHPNEDEMFLVLEGSFVMRLRDGDIRLDRGEFLIVPAGVEHMPVAESEVSILLFEPTSTVNTGDAGGDRTVTPESI